MTSPTPIAARLRQLADAATPGPWDAVKAGDERGNPSPMYRGLVCILEAGKNGVSVVAESGWVPKENWHPNADFIAEARTGVPALLAEIDALRLALAGAEERALEKVADFWEPHWRGAGIAPTADWLISEIKAYSEANDAKVTTLEARIAELEKFASSFHVTVVEASFYKDTYLHLVEPHNLSIRLLNDSSKSWLFADLEARRRSAIAPAPGEGESK